MKKTIRLILILLLIILLIGSCNFSTNTNKFGYIIISAKFPQNGFKVKTIPLNTTKIGLEISGEWLDETLKFTLTPQKPELKLLTFSGNKNIVAIAFDDTNNILGSGKNSVYVHPNTHNKVEITLVEGIAPNGSAIITSPSPTTTPIINITPTATPNGSGVDNTNNQTANPTTKPTDIVTTEPTSSPSPSNNGLTNNNTSIYYPEIKTNINIITSTPIPSGITAGIY